MPIFEQGSIVRVPFPYTDRPVRQHRPALVVSAEGLGDQQHLLWAVMITSASNRGWPGDIALIDNHVEVGLPAASLIRPAKIATIDAVHAEPLGNVGPQVLAEVKRILAAHLDL